MRLQFGRGKTEHKLFCTWLWYGSESLGTIELIWIKFCTFFNHNPLSKHLLVRWLKQSIHWRYSSRISILASVYIFDNRDHNVWIYTGEAYGRFLNFLERVIPVPTLTNCVFGSLNLASGVIRSPNLQTAYLDL
jgi:hypothetical protein